MVTDVSFVGVSTQYLVRMPWGQELKVFEQNTGRRRLFRAGRQVELSWRPSTRSCSTTTRTRRPARSSTTSEPPPMSETVRKKGPPATSCSAPAMLWLVLFFLIPFYSLVAASLFNPGGSDFRGYTVVYQWSNYTEGVKAYWPQIVRSLVYGAIATSSA